MGITFGQDCRGQPFAGEATISLGVIFLACALHSRREQAKWDVAPISTFRDVLYPSQHGIGKSVADVVTRSHRPATNIDYWLPKLARNRARDKKTDRALRAAGWRVRIVWECEILSNAALQKLADKICTEITNPARRPSPEAYG
jgi:DNA mismatch endonuclease Vsr